MIDFLLGCIIIVLLTIILTLLEDRYLRKLLREELKKYECNNN